MNAEEMKDRMRKRSASTPKTKPAPPDVTSPEAATPNGQQGTYACGHTVVLKAKFQGRAPEKLAMELKRVCPPCRQARLEKEMADADRRRARGGPPTPRDTALGCRYQLDYLAIGKWHGRLLASADAESAENGFFNEVVAEANATSMNKCISALNQKWLAKSKSQSG